MKEMMKTSIGRLRILGFAEGVSFLVLMGIAMPLKYFAGYPEAVKITGWAHGLLFVLFIAGAYLAYHQYNWPVKKLALACIAAFLPFGTFVFDARLRKDTYRKQEL
jgi:integral membrane protein